MFKYFNFKLIYKIKNKIIKKKRRKINKKNKILTLKLISFTFLNKLLMYC